MLEMGEPVRILDLAQRMIRLVRPQPRHRHPDPGHRGPARREDRRGARAPDEEMPLDFSRVGSPTRPDGDRQRPLATTLLELEEATEKRELFVRKLLFSLLGARSQTSGHDRHQHVGDRGGRLRVGPAQGGASEVP